MNARSKPLQKLAVVSIDHTDYLLPADMATKLLDLLSGALRCHRRYEGALDTKFYAQAEPDIELRLVKASDVVFPTPTQPIAPAKPGTPRLNHMPAKPANFDEGNP